MEQNYELGDEVLVRGVIEMLDYAQKPAKIKVGEDGFAWVEEVGELIPLSALDVNKQLLEACKEAREYFHPEVDMPVFKRLNEAIAAAEKGA